METISDKKLDILVVGTGLIGGSLCLALKRAGYSVDGANRSPGPLEYALSHGIIDGVASDAGAYDVVFVALPPKAAVNYILSAPFGSGAVVADICGVKQPVEAAVYSARPELLYVGTHPMAGKEVSGVENACADLFDRASMVLTRGARTDEGAFALLRKLSAEMGFARIVECSAEIHDKKIAYTSQLAHVVANAYVKNGEISSCFGFTGGSFQDMTRIAGVDEGVWSELYLLNAANLASDVDSLIAELAGISAAIKAGDGDALKEVLRRGRLLFEGGKDVAENKDIKITRLK